MSARLDELIAGARERDLDAVWNPDRSERARTGALHRRDVRTRRDRALRRGALVAGGAGLLLLCLLRITQAQGGSAPLDPEKVAVQATPEEPVAARMLADAGYARD